MIEYEEIIKEVLKSEGGYVNDPDDPGGMTNKGITLRTLRALKYDINGDGDIDEFDIKGLTEGDAILFYKREFWDKAKCDLLPEKLRYMHFDTAVNCGIRTAAKMLQRSCGVKDDGIIGKITLGAAKYASLQNYAGERLAYYDFIITRNPRLEKFRKGWRNRVNHVLNKMK